MKQVFQICQNRSTAVKIQILLTISVKCASQQLQIGLDINVEVFKIFPYFLNRTKLLLSCAGWLTLVMKITSIPYLPTNEFRTLTSAVHCLI
jgi:hypothetical protein